jgi:NADH-quinone oxidoreductase subunit H
MLLIIVIIKFLIIIVPTLLIVATLTLLERKIMAAIQIRRGPNVVGFGLLQPLADGLKLLIKELIIPLKGNKWLFLFSPMLFLSLSFATWSVIPFEEHYVASPNLTILVFLAFSSLSVYGILLGGWASNSRYAFLGALRSASQMISYELVLSLLILLVCILAQSFNFIDIVNAQTTIWFILPLAPFALVYMIAILAETNRTPFDLPEAEAELVAGYSVEYSSGPFAFYFIAEYCNLIIWSFTTVILFFGGWLPISFLPFLNGFILFTIKSMIILALFCCIRAALPRYRWDQLMTLAWRAFLPIVLLGCFFVYAFYYLMINIVG